MIRIEFKEFRIFSTVFSVSIHLNGVLLFCIFNARSKVSNTLSETKGGIVPIRYCSETLIVA